MKVPTTANLQSDLEAAEKIQSRLDSQRAAFGCLSWLLLGLLLLGLGSSAGLWMRRYETSLFATWTCYFSLLILVAIEIGFSRSTWRSLLFIFAMWLSIAAGLAVGIARLKFALGVPAPAFGVPTRMMGNLGMHWWQCWMMLSVIPIYSILLATPLLLVQFFTGAYLGRESDGHAVAVSRLQSFLRVGVWALLLVLGIVPMWALLPDNDFPRLLNQRAVLALQPVVLSTIIVLPICWLNFRFSLILAMVVPIALLAIVVGLFFQLRLDLMNAGTTYQELITQFVVGTAGPLLAIFHLQCRRLAGERLVKPARAASSAKAAPPTAHALDGD